ncbi:MAG: UDP-N-acetylglucosamine--N-acetylmuramyl-(pentapeptide) pyrophosphoryl-undecaprenol N-acetylglucosamine transferase [Gammaproteobacteria bacterium]|nr:UDP-N-acetylglucosamine--N-acetylmuramyl-(pentapeptide) pyrophosphoryl-undecaprenol N-acetylglucosamine transferase [Gammaproteobacteria bacterium]
MRTLLIMAGGTGGHVYPALSVAGEMKRRGVEVVWLGTRHGLEARVVPQAGFDIEWITIRGLKGKGLAGLLRMPFLLMLAMLQTLGVVLRRRPAAVLGMGGFVSGPGALTAWLLQIPVLIHEANAIAGFTNRWLARIARRVMTGFPVGLGPRSIHVGHPVREEILALPGPDARLIDRRGPFRILVVGGSQGARALNQHMPKLLPCVPVDVAIRHQAGRDNVVAVREIYETSGTNAEVREFISDMSAAYAWADLVVCRAGAMTVAEVCASGSAAVFVPFPVAVGDHQTANARFLCERKAAWMWPETGLTPETVNAFFAVLTRQEIRERGARARELAVPDSTQRVGDACMEVLHA